MEPFLFLLVLFHRMCLALKSPPMMYSPDPCDRWRPNRKDLF